MGKSVVNVDLLRERAFSLAKSQMFSAMALADCIESLHDAKAHETAVKTDGTRFKSFAEYAEYRNPPGLGFNADDGAANIESIVMRLITADPNRPAITHLGGKRSTGKEGGQLGNDNAKKKTTATRVAVVSVRDANTAAGMADRLQRDFKAIWAAYKRGEYASLTAAAIAAGIRKDPHGAMDAARRAWKRMTVAERRKFAAMVAKAGTGDMEETK
jgi:hypothetical protein